MWTACNIPFSEMPASVKRLVQCLRALGGGADAHCRERVADRGEEAGLLGQGTGVGNHREGVHLQAVVVMEAHGLVHAHARVQLEAGCL